MDISRAGGVDVNVIISIIESENPASWGRFAICYNLPETQAFPVFSGPNELTHIWDQGKHFILTILKQWYRSYCVTRNEKSFLNSNHFDIFGVKRDPLTVLENSQKLFPFTGNALSHRIHFPTFFQRAVSLSAIHLHSLHKSSTELLHFHPTVQLSFELFKMDALRKRNFLYFLTH